MTGFVMMVVRTQVGLKDDIAKVMRILLSKCPKINLIVSTSNTAPLPKTSKTTVFCPNLDPTLTDPYGIGVRQSGNSWFLALGSPISNSGFSEKFLWEKLNSVRNITKSLPLLNDPHAEFALLHSYFSLPKVTFLLRIMDMVAFSHPWTKFDSVMHNTLTEILGWSTFWPWIQVKLYTSQFVTKSNSKQIT